MHATETLSLQPGEKKLNFREHYNILYTIAVPKQKQLKQLLMASL